MTDDLAKVLHDAARDSLVSQLVSDPDHDLSTSDPLDVQSAKDGAEFCLSFLRFGERMALAVEMASILHDLVDSKTVSISDMEVLLARWQECKP